MLKETGNKHSVVLEDGKAYTLAELLDQVANIDDSIANKSLFGFRASE